MTSRRVRILFCFVWIAFVLAVFSFRGSSPVSGQSQPAGKEITGKLSLAPDPSMVTRFDNAIQKRFLTQPGMGIVRVEPVEPRSPHLRQFSPIDLEETASVADFENGGWRVALYLFGKQTMPKVRNGRELKTFDIRYRLHNPLPVTANLKQSQLPTAEKLIDNVKTAFLEFQAPDGPNENGYEFQIGKWSYFARPVRAANASCIGCHVDYVVTAKLGGGQFKIRKRRIGDANGVVVYGFSRKE